MSINRSIKYYFIFFFLLATCPAVLAQGSATANDTLKGLINVTLTNQTAKLFVHYDKTVYLPSENIWFTAYLLNTDALRSSGDILSVAIIKNTDHTIAVQKKFVITGAASSGGILVPDSIATGDYSVLAYTNHFVKGKPDAIFTQRIAIKRIEQPDTKTKSQLVQAPALTRTDSAKISIKFYPEGGNLVANLPQFVGWEAKDSAGALLKLKAVLLKDGEFIDTVETSAFGMGRFFIRPKPGSSYALKTIGFDNKGQFSLPAAMEQGAVITLSSAIARDTLAFKVAGTLNGKVHVVIHNNQQVFYALTNIELKKHGVFKVALDSLPRGLATITVYNENLQPCAERVFFAHYDKAAALQIVADQAKYGKRKKVILHLTFNSSTSKQGLVSVACVRTNRIDRKNFNDIESFAYLESSINNLAFSFDNRNSTEKKKYLEDVLLVHGWRRYIEDTPQQNYHQNDTSFRFHGIVTIHNKPLKKPKMLMFFGDSVTRPILTDSIGRFEMATTDLLTHRDKKLTIMATGDDAENFLIRLVDPYGPLNQNIAKSLPAYSISAPLKMSDQNDEISILENRILLKQVTIKGSKGDEYGTGPNKCGDYVCRYNYLNCPSFGHNRDSHPPVKGEVYLVPGGGTTMYQGCQPQPAKGTHFDGINIKKEFYPYGESDIILSEPLYENTLLWKNQLQLDENKGTILSFYTGDIKAGFTVIAQGITDNGVLFDEQHFEVE
ncbi:hypothetical protein [Mucilaginibacter flavidus]|uniref:hypothetical protein n=1 Tax=Mucilaginibacter flavidus TaxID=2949309 RepID=UPI002091EB8A|nr:hypothetical protein [Mucilaginibacter flavidus]MCO5947036.1 hypothetical protein [Mucilaginibacter flavidus]